jgi:lysyl-tRNA synthetase class 2
MRPEKQPMALSENEKVVFELLKKEQEMLLSDLKSASELSNKAWDKAIKGLTKLQLVSVAKQADALICKLNKA